MFFNRRQVDCSINYQIMERNLASEKPDDKLKLGYDI